MANIAYTKEGFADYSAFIRSFYQNFNLSESKQIDNKELFFADNLDYPGEELFPFKIRIEGWKYKDENQNYWNYSRLCIDYKKPHPYKKGEIVDETLYLERNYYSMYLFVVKDKDTYYLIAGHDYQGIATINLSSMTINHYLPEEALKGWGWCPVEVMSWDEENRLLSIEGCYWGGPFDTYIYKIDSFDNIDLSEENVVQVIEEKYEEEEEEEAYEVNSEGV